MGNIDPTMLMIIVGVGVAALVAMIALLMGGNDDNVDSRLKDLKSGGRGATGKDDDALRGLARDRLRDLGTLLNPKDDNERSKLQTRLIQAGIYNPSALPLFLGLKVVAILVPVGLGLLVMLIGLVSPMVGLMITLGAGIFGFIAPSFILDKKKTSRQLSMRRALPDAMDVIIICMEGGLSLPASIQRVADELAVAHPLLASELKICQREIQLGKKTGEALKQLSIRSDMEELRSLAGVVVQAEQYGASLASALRVHAESMRQRRAQKAEEMAHKASTKILFPTLVCIFPCLFIVLLGPAAVKMQETFANM